MSSFKELQKYIRFQLNQLRSLNKHHEFEHLTRQFARLRICKNIIPSTGPVGAGGDYGSDFESFRSYLISTPIATSTSIGLVADKKIIFACSLSLDERIISKIKEDVDIICMQKDFGNIIYYFSEADIPVGKRKKLVQWCRYKYNIELEVLDGQALSELLTEVDLFWIATEYLDVPSDMYPEYSKISPNYKEYKKTWLIDNSTPYSISDFYEIKSGVRQATFDKDCKPDLTRWLKKIEEFLNPKYPLTLRRKAIYEICVASLRGLNNLTHKIKLIEEYFSDIKKIKTTSEIQCKLPI